MIPQRVKITGFLSYKDEQEVRFDSAPLWMLAGSNGSGKSSIFDGLTYALFGHHRGGSQNASELINKESNALAVEFDFKLDGELYRIKRTLRKNARGAAAGTQQIFHHGPGGWEAERDTNKRVDFDAWIHDHIGLNYETFTSSVLLLQGKAEKLLDARPSGRAEVLAGIVDLERYQRLHERANARKLELKSKLEALTHQKAAVPEVSDLEYAAALMKIDEGEEARKLAQTQIDSLADLEAHARRWSDTRIRLEASRAKLTQAESLLGAAVKIEKEFARLQELRDVLPAANTVVLMRSQLHESQRKTDRLTKDQDDAKARKLQAESAHKQSKQKRELLQKSLVTDEAKQTKINGRLRELSAILEKVRLVEDQESELRRLDEDLGRLPKEPEQAVRATQDEVDRLTELNRVLPILERFQTERHDLAAAIKAEQTAKAEQLRIQADGAAKKTVFEKLQADAERAKLGRAAADEQAGVAKAMADRAAESAAEFATLSGAKKCRACGQALTKKHFSEEKEQRDREAKEAQEHLRKATEERATATALEAKLNGEVAASKKEVDDLREAYRDHQALARQAAADVKRLTDSLGLRYAEMPEPYKSRIAAATPTDWVKTAYPARDELIALRREAANLDGFKRQLREARDVLEKCSKLKARSDTVRSTLAKLQTGLPSDDPAKLREEQRSLQSEETAVLNSIRGNKQAILAADTEIDKLGREAHTAVQNITDLQGKLNTEEVSRKLWRETADRAMKNLPPAWLLPVEGAGLTEYHVWVSEQDALIAAETEAKFRQLEQARGGLTALRSEIASLETEADAFPTEARRAPDEVRALLAAARAALAERDKELRESQRNKGMLDSYRDQRAELGEQFVRTDLDHNRYKLLSELLGRDRLQRHLVRQAERQIVDYANAVLDRLSSGQLFLRLVGSDDGTDRALDMECSNRITGGAPINVAFLSGSQRFRVAVSLALAIGQYASKQHRPIESVIIDEGFGCLDRQGRQVMIQELHNLRGHLHCILLVSHQEEFADAFADGYRFELQNGATKVSRFVR